MKKLLLLTVLCASILNLSAQQITPERTTEQCPGVNITFSVTIAAQSVQSISAKALNIPPLVVQQPYNVVSAGGNITFNFVGRFADANNKQTFTVNYTDAANTPSVYDFTFPKIKSLQTANSFSQINPTPISITAQRCQTQNFNISFPNVQYGNPYETPPISYGTVTNYEYLLPQGWSLNGGSPSNGGSWLPGNNNVTVTSDLSNGANGFIRIRPVNTQCANGLLTGQEATVSINRPAPNLTISGSQETICSGSANYSVNGMPSGSSVVWTLSNNIDASIVGCSTCTSVTVSRNTSNSTSATLTATVTHCSFTYPVNYTISLGSPQPQNLQFILIDPIMGKLQARVDPVPGATGYRWYKDGVLFTFPGGGTGSNFVQFNIARTCDVWYNIAVEAINACGTSAQTQSWAYVPCDNYYRISPNPATTEVAVSVDETKTIKGTTATIEAVKIYDLQGNLKKYQKYTKVKRTKVNVEGLSSGTYFIEIISGTYKERKQLLIQK